MGIVPRKETERRLRIMARTQVDMERGVYQWPDGRNPLHPDGRPVVIKREIARSAGYDANSNQRNMDKWFDDPYFKRQVEVERVRRDVNMDEVLQSEENLPIAIAKGLFLEMLSRLVADPGGIPTAQILTFAPQLHKYGLELEAKKEPRRKPDRTDEVNQTVSGQLYDMNPTERAHLVASTQEASEKRMAAVKMAVAKANVLTEPADADHSGRDAGAADSTVAS